MTTRACAVLGLLTGAWPALMGQAHAQTLPNYGFVIDIDHDTLMPGQSTRVTLAATFNEPESVKVAGVGLGLLISTGIEGWSDAALIAPMDGPGTSPGTLLAAGYDRIVAGQLLFPIGHWEPDPNPTLFWQATYTAPLDTARAFDVELATETFAYHVYVSPFSAESIEVTDRVVEGAATIHVVPSPAGASVLGLILVAVKRRRR
jgi:hypothetical protein